MSKFRINLKFLQRTQLFNKRNIINPMEPNIIPKKFHNISIAPMIDVTTTHFRYFMRLLTKQATLYTQMIHHNAILNNHEHVLPFNQIEHPIVLQIGGSDPKLLAEAALIGQKYGYDQINLNVGCPSPRVQSGSFGVCLMKQPELVYQCMKQIANTVKIPCTVKCRLGVDQFDSYEFVSNFVRIVSGNGKGPIRHFVLHARKAYLKGLSPLQNRNVPPLQYDKVYKLKQQFPQLQFTLNGGIKTLNEAKNILQQHSQLHGCMIGRTAYQNPYQFRQTDELFYFAQKKQPKTRKQILYEYANYVQKLENHQLYDQLNHIIRKPNSAVLVKPLINLYHGQRYCAKYRQMLSNVAQIKNQTLDQLIRNTADAMEKLNQKKYHIQEFQGEIIQQQTYLKEIQKQEKVKKIEQNKQMKNQFQQKNLNN